MPFDSATFKLPAVKPATFDPVLREGLAGLAQLSEALRHPEWWEARGHEWYFPRILENRSCGTTGCAWGVAMTLWPKQVHRADMYFAVGPAAAGHFGIPESEGWRIFGTDYVRSVYGVTEYEVTPAMVADAIDALLAAKGWKG